MDDALYRVFYEQEESHWWFAARREILIRVVEAYGDLRDGDTVLDVGCGTGANAKALAARYRVIGMDASPLAVKYARKRGVEAILAEDLDAFPSERFDVRAVLLFDVIEHIDDDVAVLKRAGAIAKRVIVTVPAYMWMWGRHDVANHHKRRYDAGMLRRALDAAGLEVLKLSYFNTLLFPLAVVHRALGRSARDKEVEAAVDAMDPPAGNAILRRVFALEKRIVPRVDLPFGLSLLAVARVKT